MRTDFSEPNISKAASLYLFALGPDCHSIHPCDNVTDDIHLPNLVSEHLLSNAADVDVTSVASGRVAELVRLRERLLLTFDSQSPASCRLWSNSRQPRGEAGSRREQQRLRVSDVSVAATCDLNTDLAPKLHSPLRLAVAGVGGVSVFLFSSLRYGK